MRKAFGAALAMGLILFVNPSSAQVGSACDLNHDGVVNVSDVTLAKNMTLGLIPCTANVTTVGKCDVVVLQRVINASNGGACVTGTSGAVALSSVSCPLSVLGSGGLSLCTVTLSNAATSNTIVTLSSNNGSLTVPGSVTVLAGLSTATFTAIAGILNLNSSAIVTATLAGDTTTTTITLNGTTPHSVTLDWTAPNSIGLIGYNIYRGSASSGPFTKVNSLPIVGLTYTDNNVEAGQTYFYVATSVAAAGESAYSSPAVQAKIPTP